MKLSDTKGFTLSELMLGAMILVFCLTSILTMFLSSSLLTESTQSQTAVTTHAQYILEEIKDTGFSQIASKIDNHDWDLTTAQLSAAPYNFSTLANESVDTGVFQTGNPLGVSVTITYKLQGRMNRTYEVRTLFTE